MQQLQLASKPTPTRSQLLALSLLHLLPKRLLSRLIGKLARCPLPRPLRPFLLGIAQRILGIDIEEAAERDLRAYPSVQALFTRRLDPSARPLPAAPEQHLLAPVDGLLSLWGPIEGNCLIQAKGLEYRLEDLLISRRAAEQFHCGTQAVLYLSPPDYHRVHAPLAMRVEEVWHVPGTCRPVFPASSQRVPGLFAANERLVLLGASAAGKIALVMVAAFGVGNMRLPWLGGVATNRARRRSIQSWQVDRSFDSGAELGIFALGSTVILLLDPKIDVELESRPGPIRVHTPLARLI